MSMIIEAFVSYLRFERSYSEETISNYQCDLIQVEAFFLEVFDLNEVQWRRVQGADVDEWISYLMDRGYMSSTVRVKLSSLRSFFRYLLKREIIHKNPMQFVVAPKMSKRLPVFLREYEINKLLDDTLGDTSFEAIRNRLIIQFFYMTGVRVSEIINLVDTDIDFLRKSIRVLGKGNKERMIPFGEELFVSMENYIRARNDALEFRISHFFFVGIDGKIMRYSEILNIVKAYLSRVSSLKKCSPHVLRHSFATAMMNGGADIAAVQSLLGHENLATTQIYTHTTFEELKKVYNQAHPRS